MLALSPRPASALIGDALGLSPYWDWKTIESEHFRVTFPAELLDAARKTTNYYEEAHGFLSKALKWQPRSKVQIVVINNGDQANGLTSALGRLGMVIYVTPPEPFYSTNYYDDWLRLLVIHEYTHFLNMDATQNVYSFLRYIFGDLFLPNTLWPTWMLEGLAVYMETRYTHLGRGRSPLYEMILRAAVDENRLATSDHVTLDRLNGDYPFHPSGEIPYLFGYQLMNRVAQEPVKDELTADLDQPLANGEDALGTMSWRSAGRFPFFINGNLENITGKDWYTYWDEWVAETRARVQKQLARITSNPVTSYEKIEQEGLEALGTAASADGQWLAYTMSSPDRRTGLYLRNLGTGEVRRLSDKISGASMSFTPDSKWLLASSVHRVNLYYTWTDLAVYEVSSGNWRWLSDELRARDPDVSRDGTRVVFAISENSYTTLAVADLKRDDHGWPTLGSVRKLPTTGPYDRASTPKLSIDGQKIYYALHRNGRPAEELMAWDLDTDQTTTLISNGHMNRAPTVHPNGDLYFVSDLSGVDNLYRLDVNDLDRFQVKKTMKEVSPVARSPHPELATNLKTGLNFPTFGPTTGNDAPAYATVYSARGWNVSRIQLLKTAVDATDVSIDPPPAPRADEKSSNHAASIDYEARDYSAFPSLLPRQWTLLALPYLNGAYIQTEAAGFDAVDRHNYLVALGYNTSIPKLDYAAIYSNRSFGPTLTLLASERTTGINTNDLDIIDYTREENYTLTLALPIRWTFSGLTPTFGVNAGRTTAYIPGFNPTNGDVLARSLYVPSADLALYYSNAETSSLAVGNERGRSTAVGTRVYSTPSRQTWKAAFQGSEFLPLGHHVTLNPSVKGQWTSGFNSGYGPANAVVEGYIPQLFAIGGSGIFDGIKFRGYPERVFYSRSVAVGALDLRFPIFRIFRGIGTYPIFFDNLYGFVFTEATWFPSATGAVRTLPSAGGGLRLSTELPFSIPVTGTLEYHHGLREVAGGKADLVATFRLGAYRF